MKSYYIHNGQTQLGPFTIDQLKHQQVDESTPAWFEGLVEWSTIGKIPELLEMLKQKRTPPPYKGSTTPPPYQANTYDDEVAYQNEMEEYFPAKRNKLTPTIVISGIFVLLIVAWLMLRNTQNTATIKKIEDRVAGEN